MSVLNPGKYATMNNLMSMCFQFPEMGLLTIGIAITMITAGADLSIVSIANLTATVNGIILIQLMPEDASGSSVVVYMILCIFATVIIGILCGSLNGLLIGKLSIFPILATLGTQNLFTGISMILTRGVGVFGTVPAALTFIGSGRILGILPVPLILFLVALLLVYTLIHRTPYGMKTQWFGANRKASFYAGIDNVKTVFKTYLFSALLGSVTGFLILARTASAKADYGSTLVLQALLASVLGGISPLGGKGNILNVFLSIISLQLLDSGFNFLRISSFVRASTYGGLLIVSIVIEYIINKYQMKREAKRAIMATQDD
ncbi:MAG: ABC transporter permease [Tissierellaceae bacterium]|nr:ABC transporter permease [Tissierellaceae bacterium]